MAHYGCNDLLTILSSIYSAFLLCLFNEMKCLLRILQEGVARPEEN